MATIKHIHANLSIFNGQLCFVVDNRLMTVSVITPNFNDFGEWRVRDIHISSKPYDPSTNEVELNPMKFPDIEVSDKCIKYLDAISVDDMTDEEADEFLKLYPDNQNETAGGYCKGESVMTIAIDDDEPDGMPTREFIKYDKWLESPEKSEYTQVAYPILYNFSKNFKSFMKK